MRHRNIARRGVSRFAFIDLFAGIGGMRMAFEHAGGTCLYSSEWNKYSQQTYRANFGETPDGDITKADENALLPCREKPVMRTILERNVPDKYTLSDKLWTYLQNYAAKHKAAGHGFGYGIAPFDGISRTLSARYYKDGSEILIAQEGKNPRRLTPRECARLQGFPDTFKIVVSDTQAYRQFGNSVVVPLMERIAERIIGTLETAADAASERRCAIIHGCPVRFGKRKRCGLRSISIRYRRCDPAIPRCLWADTRRDELPRPVQRRFLGIARRCRHRAIHLTSYNGFPFFL